MFTPSQALGKAAQWKALSSGSKDYFQTGTDIPTISEGEGGAYAAGSDFPPQGFDYQYQTPETVAGGPSYEIEQPVDINDPYWDNMVEKIENTPGYANRPLNMPRMYERLRQMKNAYGVRGV